MIDHDNGLLCLTMAMTTTMVKFVRPWYSLGRKGRLWLTWLIMVDYDLA